MKRIHLLIHLAENGTPPDKSGVLYHLLQIEFHDFNSNIDILGLSYFGFWY